MTRVEPAITPEQLAALVLEYQRALTAERLAWRLERAGRLNAVEAWRRNSRRHRALMALQQARL